MIQHANFDKAAFAYLNGDATAKDVIALRDTLRTNPDLRSRFTALVRLHRAQSIVLARRSPLSFAGVLKSLREFANRAGRFFAHACVLVLVVVELDVAVPGIDTHSWIQPLMSISEESSMDDETMPIPEVDEVNVDEDSAPMPDVREADFLES